LVNKSLCILKSIVFVMLAESSVSKGYLTVVPKAVRRAVKISAGDKLGWTVEGDKIVLVPRRARTLVDLTGLISHGGDAVTAKRRTQRGQP
jgi:bifunctional DNA-binding transcriptional regulator/antitoxin component of YhaV-PrlF toxin-antitoxin module